MRAMTHKNASNPSLSQKCLCCLSITLRISQSLNTSLCFPQRPLWTQICLVRELVIIDITFKVSRILCPRIRQEIPQGNAGSAVQIQHLLHAFHISHNLSFSDARAHTHLHFYCSGLWDSGSYGQYIGGTFKYKGRDRLGVTS